MCPEDELKAKEIDRKSFVAVYLQITPLESCAYGGTPYSISLKINELFSRIGGGRPVQQTEFQCRSRQPARISAHTAGSTGNPSLRFSARICNTCSPG